MTISTSWYNIAESLLSRVQYKVYIYNTSQMSKLSLTLYTFSVTGSVASQFLTLILKVTE